jgi:hypothetical protein
MLLASGVKISDSMIKYPKVADVSQPIKREKKDCIVVVLPKRNITLLEHDDKTINTYTTVSVNHQLKNYLETL